MRRQQLRLWSAGFGIRRVGDYCDDEHWPDGGWWIIPEPEIHGGAQVLVPDLAGWRRETLDRFPADQAWFSVPPDWVCEILSPSTASYDRGAKARIYAGWGLGHYWLPDPDRKSLEALKNTTTGWVTAARLRVTRPPRPSRSPALRSTCRGFGWRRGGAGLRRPARFFTCCKKKGRPINPWLPHAGAAQCNGPRSWPIEHFATFPTRSNRISTDGS